MVVADDGTRTHTPVSRKRILSPLRLPFRHIGQGEVSVCYVPSVRVSSESRARPWVRRTTLTPPNARLRHAIYRTCNRRRSFPPVFHGCKRKSLWKRHRWSRFALEKRLRGPASHRCARPGGGRPLARARVNSWLLLAAVAKRAGHDLTGAAAKRPGSRLSSRPGRLVSRVLHPAGAFDRRRGSRKRHSPRWILFVPLTVVLHVLALGSVSHRLREVDG